MGFQRSDGDSEMSEINITPLVDVMLVLLVAFIVTAPLLTNVVKVTLPQAAKTAPPAQEKAHTLEINATGEFRLDDQLIAEENLESALTQLKAKMDEAETDTPLHLQADETLSYGKVVAAMAIIERTGIQRLAVFTRPK
ncbi:Biopolymer transport protein ExbD/TolR [gamma proteobacterium HdN1]|nr:Biopolymer transport protein ExbD/TolR [gamma proteobacterium HdN1]